MFKKDLFANILSKINTTYDSMSEFGKIADLDRSYISKYINKKLENPPSPDILKKISEASKGIISYYELMEICGYIDLSCVFLLNDGFETNLCYWNKEDLKDIGFSQEDIKQLVYLSNNNNVKNKNKKISEILNKYPESVLTNFYNKAISQTNMNREQNNILPLYELKKRLTDLIEKNEIFLSKSTNQDDDLKKIGAIPLSKIEATKIPVLGKVKAGYNYLAQENIIDYIAFNIDGADKENYYALYVIGDSMEPLFDDGDIVIVHKQNDFNNGDNCVILINGDEATIKKVYKGTTGIKLQAVNPYYPPRIFTEEEIRDLPVKIIGVVEKSIRNFKKK